MLINELLEDCILLIFDRLPLVDLFRTEIVCTKWQALFQVACRNRRTVMLLVGTQELITSADHDPIRYSDDALQIITNSEFPTRYKEEMVNNDGTQMFVSLNSQADRNGLRFDALKHSSCIWLTKMLPNVSTLRISCSNGPRILLHIASSNVEEMIYFFMEWSPNLTVLEIWYKGLLSCNDLIQLVDSINLLPSLKRLILDLGEALPDMLDNLKGRIRNIPLPILARLEQINISISFPSDLIVDSLLRYALPNDALQHIGVISPSMTMATVNKFMNLDPHLASRFTHLFGPTYNHNRDQRRKR